MADGIAGGLDSLGCNRYPGSGGEANEPVAKVSPSVEEKEKQNDDQQTLRDAAENRQRGFEDVASGRGHGLHNCWRSGFWQMRARALHLLLNVLDAGLDSLQPLGRTSCEFGELRSDIVGV